MPLLRSFHNTFNFLNAIISNSRILCYFHTVKDRLSQSYQILLKLSLECSLVFSVSETTRSPSVCSMRSNKHLLANCNSKSKNIRTTSGYKSYVSGNINNNNINSNSSSSSSISTRSSTAAE